MPPWIEASSLLGLFAASFLGATLLPLSSEAALVAGLATGVPILPAVVVCSIGNCLACALNFGLGRFFAPRMEARMQRSRSGRKALEWLHRYGPWSLLLTWAPIIGDPLTIGAGLVRLRTLYLFTIIIPIRVGRYVLIGAAF